MRVSEGRIGVRRPLAGLGHTAFLGGVIAASLWSCAPAFALPPGAQQTPPPSSLGKDDDEQDSWSEAISQKMKDSISAATARMGMNKPPGPAPLEAPSGCPTIALLPGTESQRVMIAGDASNQGLKYQYTLSGVGRECAISGDRVTIRVGADGRVLLGPAGAAGRFDVPIRVAVFSEAQGKPVESRLFRVPVSMAAGQVATPFRFVSDSVTVRIPPGRTAEYSIKVGIDGGGKSEAGPKVKHARRQKPAQEAAAQ